MTAALTLTVSIIAFALSLTALALVLLKLGGGQLSNPLDGSGLEVQPPAAPKVLSDVPSLGLHHPSKDAIESAESARLYRLKAENFHPYLGGG